MINLSDVTFVKRIRMGSIDPENLASEEDVRAASALLNRCLNDNPKGKILGMEKTFSLLNIGEHQVVLQAMIYHVGFVRKPYWLESQEKADATSPTPLTDHLRMPDIPV